MVRKERKVNLANEQLLRGIRFGSFQTVLGRVRETFHKQ
jgi:hypothetical protein